jgi:hypothetical protein
VNSATSICDCRFMTFAARVDSTRAAIDLLPVLACSPRHVAAW